MIVCVSLSYPFRRREQRRKRKKRRKDTRFLLRLKKYWEHCWQDCRIETQWYAGQLPRGQYI